MEANASSSIAVMFSFSIDSSEACEVACIVYTVMTTAVPMAPDNWRMLSEKQQLTQLLDYLYIHRNYLLILFKTNQFEEQLFSLLKQLVEIRRKNTEKDLPAEYVDIDIKTASLVGIIIWWLRKGLHFSSDYIANQIYLMYRVQ